MLRLLSCLTILAAFALTPAQSAPNGQTEGAKAPETRIESNKKAEWIANDYKTARERDEARQLLWDKRMKAVTKDVCTGC